MKKFNNKKINRRGANAYMNLGGTIPWMESVESSLEQRPRAMHGAIAETQRFIFLAMWNCYLYKFIDEHIFIDDIKNIKFFSPRLCASAVKGF